MAKFESGHLHIERHALNNDDVSYDLCIDYNVVQDPNEGKGMQFTMHGMIQGRDVNETFFLPKDMAYNFARNLTQIFANYGVSKVHSRLGTAHKF